MSLKSSGRKRSKTCSILLGVVLLVMGCGGEKTTDDSHLKKASWNEISGEGEGKEVTFMMWQGSPVINDYINNYVAPEVRKRFNITLNISGGQGPEIVQLVMGEKQADIQEGQVDMVWINGETFFQLRKIDGLWGPFVKQLPHAAYIDFEDPYINTDFQQAINYMECPWSISQFALTYDSARIAKPPANLEELEAHLRQHPGTFTISNDFTGMTLLKCFLAELSGSPQGLNGAFEEKKYKELSNRLWEYINRNKAYFWKGGDTFPREQTRVAQLFANGELDLVYGYGEGGIEEKVLSGLYPKSVKGYAWANGTIKNANYLGILQNSPQKAAAMQVINFLISPEAQLKKSAPDGMNANTILDFSKMPEEWQEKFKRMQKRQYGPSMEDLESRAIEEPAPEYMIRLYEDFRTEVIEK